MQEKTAAAILKKPRWAKVTASALGVIAIMFIILMIYWSRTPDVFWVNHTVENDRIVVGYSTTDTLIRVANTMLDKPGGYLSNDRMPPSVFLDSQLGIRCTGAGSRSRAGDTQ